MVLSTLFGTFKQRASNRITPQCLLRWLQNSSDPDPQSFPQWCLATNDCCHINYCKPLTCSYSSSKLSWNHTSQNAQTTQVYFVLKEWGCNPLILDTFDVRCEIVSSQDYDGSINARTARNSVGWQDLLADRLMLQQLNELHTHPAIVLEALLI